jgi:chromosome segregation ATPase
MSNNSLTSLKQAHNRKLIELMQGAIPGGFPEDESTNNGDDGERHRLVEHFLKRIRASIENIDQSALAAEVNKQNELTLLRQRISDLNHKIEEAERGKAVVVEGAEREVRRRTMLERRAQYLAQKVAENLQQARQIAELERQLKSSQDEIELLQQRVAQLSSLPLAKGALHPPGEVIEQEEISQLSPRTNEIYWRLKSAIVSQGGRS